MKILSITLLIILFSSCQSKSESKKQEDYFYTVSRGLDGETLYYDTVDLKHINKHEPKDTLLRTKYFKMGDEGHRINLYTNELHAPTDGNMLHYELDDLGIIYSQSLTWGGYGRLISSNDSINAIIDVALENIILHKEFFSVDFDSLRNSYTRPTVIIEVE